MGKPGRRRHTRADPRRGPGPSGRVGASCLMRRVGRTSPGRHVTRHPGHPSKTRRIVSARARQPSANPNLLAAERFEPEPHTRTPPTPDLAALLQSMKVEELNSMLMTFIALLLILWLLGLITSYTIGGLLHVLLVIAVVLVLARAIQGRTA